jgi:hypothetical protein
VVEREQHVALEWDTLKNEEFCGLAEDLYGLTDESPDSDRVRLVARRLRENHPELLPAERYGTPEAQDKQNFDLIKKDLQNLGKLAG